MKRKTINLEKFLELYEPFMEIGGWCKEKHERKHDLYDYFRKIESISIESRKGLAELIYETILLPFLESLAYNVANYLA